MNSLVSRSYLLLALPFFTLGLNAGGLSVADAQSLPPPQTGHTTGLMPDTGLANLTHFQRHNALTSDGRAHFLMKTLDPVAQLNTTNSVQLYSTVSRAASGTSPAPFDYQLQYAFANTRTGYGLNPELDASGADSTSDLFMVGDTMHLVYNTLANNQSGIHYLKLEYYPNGTGSLNANGSPIYWKKVTDIQVVTAPAHGSNQAYSTYNRPALAVTPSGEVWIGAIRVEVSAPSTDSAVATPPPMYNYLVLKSSNNAGQGQTVFIPDGNAMAALRGPSVASTRSIRPLACADSVAFIYTDARDIDEFDAATNYYKTRNPPKSRYLPYGIPTGYAASAPVAFYLTYSTSTGGWAGSMDTAFYSRSVQTDIPPTNDDHFVLSDPYYGKESPFIKQYDGDGAHFSAVAVAYLSANNTPVPTIHLVTFDGDRTALYSNARPGLAFSSAHSFPAAYGQNGEYQMQADYMHISYDPASRKVLATFDAADMRDPMVSRAKALLTFTSTNGGATWNDTTPDVMTPFQTNRDTGNARFEMPAIIRYPQVFLQQVDTMEEGNLSDFTFYTYSLPAPATN